MASPIYNKKAWRDVRAVVLERDGWVCSVAGCGKRAEAVDHIVSWRDGGAWYDLENLRAICTFHNSQRVKRPNRVGESKRRTSRDW